MHSQHAVLQIGSTYKAHIKVLRKHACAVNWISGFCYLKDPKASCDHWDLGFWQTPSKTICVSLSLWEKQLAIFVNTAKICTCKRIQIFGKHIYHLGLPSTLSKTFLWGWWWYRQFFFSDILWNVTFGRSELLSEPTFYETPIKLVKFCSTIKETLTCSQLLEGWFKWSHTSAKTTHCDGLET